MWSRNLVNEEALAHGGGGSYEQETDNKRVKTL